MYEHESYDRDPMTSYQEIKEMAWETGKWGAYLGLVAGVAYFSFLDEQLASDPDVLAQTLEGLGRNEWWEIREGLESAADFADDLEGVVEGAFGGALGAQGGLFTGGATGFVYGAAKRSYQKTRDLVTNYLSE